MELPAKGGLAAETVTSNYTNQGYLAGITGFDTYLASTQYYWHGAPREQVLGSGTKRVRLATTIDGWRQLPYGWWPAFGDSSVQRQADVDGRKIEEETTNEGIKKWIPVAGA